MNRIDHLDGLRGLAALWVLIGHCMILTGFHLPVLGQPDLGVDLFILLSGFLMTFQYDLRKGREDWGAPATWIGFWVRRFFRLSPLYFCLLIVALMAGTQMYADRLLIDNFLHHAPQSAERYTDGSAKNIVLHLTYAFGLLPDYAFRTPLPDWSLGLEMQFYAVFPFAILLVRKTGWLRAAVVIAIIAAVVAYAAKAGGVAFPMPSFLPLKMHLFLAGMLIAAALDGQRLAYLGVAVLLAAIPIGGQNDALHLVVRETLLIGFFALVHGRTLPGIERVSRTLGSPVFHWLGELSFGAYLLHLLVLHRVAAWTIATWDVGMSSAARFGVTLMIVAPVVYAIACATYFLIERPGQSLGRSILAHFGTRRLARQTAAEEIAAP
ncbi:Acyltransferase protein [Sphingomonas sp. EC-HK361]|uniref:acyltransferase family protein n=1 Tax=Sphingomonas sp. EC-HK361 TaxID=2038397 RepID=UPI0012564259|nr:acyltransferase [Sphingomonas sp. EC-HK361]VVT13049.1 Acyltransferase protein [Sphingomonas sp. EC-HK361]